LLLPDVLFDGTLYLSVRYAIIGKSNRKRTSEEAKTVKRYEYVNIHIGNFFGAKCEEHQDIINSYAEKGFRYVGYIPTKMTDYGKIVAMDLIFETDE
jgi:hypothetical protein